MKSCAEQGFFFVSGLAEATLENRLLASPTLTLSPRSPPAETASLGSVGDLAKDSRQMPDFQETAFSDTCC